MIDAERETPVTGRGGYALALLIILAAPALIAWLVVTAIDGAAQRLTQVVVPGEADLLLDEPGSYTIFRERGAVVDGRLYSSDGIEGLYVSIRSEATGEPVAVKPPVGSSHYTIAGRSGRSVLAFEIAEPGVYRLVAGYPDGRKGPEGVLAVGNHFLGSLFSVIFQGLAIGAASMIAAGAVTFRTWRRRHPPTAETSGPALDQPMMETAKPARHHERPG